MASIDNDCGPNSDQWSEFGPFVPNGPILMDYTVSAPPPPHLQQYNSITIEWGLLLSGSLLHRPGLYPSLLPRCSDTTLQLPLALIISLCSDRKRPKDTTCNYTALLPGISSEWYYQDRIQSFQKTCTKTKALNKSMFSITTLPNKLYIIRKQHILFLLRSNTTLLLYTKYNWRGCIISGLCFKYLLEKLRNTRKQGHRKRSSSSPSLRGLLEHFLR